MNHVALADRPAIAYRYSSLAEQLLDSSVERGPRNERDRCRGRRSAEAPEHRSIYHRLRRGDGGVGIAHHCPRDEAALNHYLWLHAKHGRFPQHDVGELARLNRAHLTRDAVSYGGGGCL